MNIVTHKDVSKLQWHSFVMSHSQSTIFHTSYYYDIFYGIKGFSPFALFAINEDKQIIGMLSGIKQIVKPGLLSMVSKRVVCHSSPIIGLDTNHSIIGLLLKSLKNYGGVYSEIRNSMPYSNEINEFDIHGYSFEDHLNIIIDLSKSEDQLWSEVHSKRRNEIRKAYKEGLKFKEFNVDQLPCAYKILHEVYTRAKLPLMPYDFFHKGFELSNDIHAMKGFGAFYGDELIGCMIVLCHKSTVYDFYAGSYSKYYAKNPNDLIPWEVFLWGIKNGYTSFDFGGAGKPNVPYGVRDYKLKFGGTLVNYGRMKRFRNLSLYKVAENGFSVLQHLGFINR